MLSQVPVFNTATLINCIKLTKILVAYCHSNIYTFWIFPKTSKIILVKLCKVWNFKINSLVDNKKYSQRDSRTQRTGTVLIAKLSK